MISMSDPACEYSAAIREGRDRGFWIECTGAKHIGFVVEGTIIGEIPFDTIAAIAEFVLESPHLFEDDRALSPPRPMLLHTCALRSDV